MTPLTSTLADLTAAKLTAYYPPPAPGASLISGSTDVAVYGAGNPDYIKFQNEQDIWHFAVDVPNQYKADRFDFACKQWEMGGKSPFLPAPPQYTVFDVAAYNLWWTQYSAAAATYSTDHTVPPFFFIKPALLPPDPVILAPDAPPHPPQATDGPIGTAVPNNPGVFNSAGSAADNYPDGHVYVGPTGIYQKHIYSNPFTAGNVRIVWIALQLTPAS